MPIEFTDICWFMKLLNEVSSNADIARTASAVALELSAYNLELAVRYEVFIVIAFESKSDDKLNRNLAIAIANELQCIVIKNCGQQPNSCKRHCDAAYRSECHYQHYLDQKYSPMPRDSYLFAG